MLTRLSRSIRFGVATESQLINPYTHEPLPSRPYITDSQLFDRVSECSRDYRRWRRVSLPDRKAAVSRFVESVIGDKQALKPLIADFTGKSYRNIDEEFSRIQKVSANLINDADIALREMTKTTSFLGRSLSNQINQDPVGLTMIFPYFSEPIFDSLIHLIPCLISGNGALLKVSDFNHFLGEYMNKKCNQILGYKNLVNDAFISPELLPLIRQFRPIKKVNFSGSRSSARRIFEVLVENRFIDCNLFYGAQEAAYVDETADLSLAAEKICRSAFYNNGQSYECVRRLYVHESIAAQLTELITAKIANLKIGDPKNPDTDLGPITIQESVLRFQELVNDAINMDARCVIGGMTSTDGQTKGLFCEPTLLVNCDPNMQVIQEQFNAPLLCQSEVADFNQLLQEFKDNSYGTGIRIFTQDPTKYKDKLDLFEAGMICFNSACILDSDLPIEGWKGSGKGKILSELSYEEYVVPKSFIIDESF